MSLCVAIDINWVISASWRRTHHLPFMSVVHYYVSQVVLECTTQFFTCTSQQTKLPCNCCDFTWLFSTNLSITLTFHFSRITVEQGIVFYLYHYWVHTVLHILIFVGLFNLYFINFVSGIDVNFTLYTLFSFQARILRLLTNICKQVLKNI